MRPIAHCPNRGLRRERVSALHAGQHRGGGSEPRRFEPQRPHGALDGFLDVNIISITFPVGFKGHRFHYWKYVVIFSREEAIRIGCLYVQLPGVVRVSIGCIYTSSTTILVVEPVKEFDLGDVSDAEF